MEPRTDLSLDLESIEDQSLIERYVTGRLSPTDAARFEEHYLGDPELAEQVMAAQRLQLGLQAVAAQEAVRTAAALSFWQRLVRGRFFAAVPLLLLLGLSALYFFQQGQLRDLERTLEAARQPQVNTAIFDLKPFRDVGLGTPPPSILTLSSEFEWVVLTLADPGQQPPYRVELVDADGQAVWEAPGLQPDPLDRLIMTLPSTLFQAGEYELKMVDAAGNVGPSYVLRVELRS